MGYKVRINEYFATIRPGGEGEVKPAAEAGERAPNGAAPNTASAKADTPAKADTSAKADASAKTDASAGGDDFSIDEEAGKVLEAPAAAAKPAGGGS
jgi:hypothetical protein